MLTPEQLADLPVFPLPGVVFFPGSLLPLHIFEPRYRAMTAWCLEQDSPMAVCLEGEDGELAPVCGVGRIQRHLKLPDGRYNLVLAGEDRVALGTELPLRQGFRRFEVSAQPDLDGGEVAVARHMGAIRALGSGLATTVPSLGHLLTGLLERGMPPGQIADQIVDFTTLKPRDKQAVLQERDPVVRLAKVEGLLAELLATSVHDHGHS